MYHFMKNSETFLRTGLIQIIHKLTRGDNTLDLMITNNPTNINRTEVLAGNSDHDCCYTELNINPMKYKEKHRNISIFNKAGWDNFRQQMKEVNKTLQNCYEKIVQIHYGVYFGISLSKELKRTYHPE